MINLNDYTHLLPGTKETTECCKRGKKTGVIFADASRLTFYCARCGMTCTQRRPGLMREVWNSIIPNKIGQTKEVRSIPPDCVHLSRVSYEARTRIRGLLGTAMHSILCKYSPMYNRIVLPVYPVDTTLIQLVQGEPVAPIGAQLRSITGEQPKYFTVGTNWYGTAPCPSINGAGHHECIVFTEDILSSYAVTAEYPGARGVALLGTSTNIANLFHIVTHFIRINRDTKFIVWLDPDAPGRAKSLVLAGQLELLGVRHVRVVSDDDPKMHTSSYIYSIIGVACNAGLDVVTSAEVQE